MMCEENRDGRPVAIRVEHLYKTVSDADRSLNILEDIGFEVLQGETIAITGASGSGKSTLLGLLAGLDLPSQGSITVLGQALTDMDEEARTRLRGAHVGFVFQSFQLMNHLSALENVAMPLELLKGESMKTRAAQVLAEVGLGERLHHTPRTLSGGEQQRVAIARAFATAPAILFADEPTGSLDAATGERVAQLMFDLARKRGTTLVLVTHDVALASRCDRVIHIAAGRQVPAVSLSPAVQTAIGV